MNSQFYFDTTEMTSDQIEKAISYCILAGGHNVRGRWMVTTPQIMHHRHEFPFLIIRHDGVISLCNHDYKFFDANTMTKLEI